ncbi:unnamed protein product, partial [Closterium sp. NIES-54]
TCHFIISCRTPSRCPTPYLQQRRVHARRSLAIHQRDHPAHATPLPLHLGSRARIPLLHPRQQSLTPRQPLHLLRCLLPKVLLQPGHLHVRQAAQLGQTQPGRVSWLP